MIPFVSFINYRSFAAIYLFALMGSYVCRLCGSNLCSSVLLSLAAAHFASRPGVFGIYGMLGNGPVGGVWKFGLRATGAAAPEGQLSKLSLQAS